VNERWLEILLNPMRDQITVAETCRRYGIARQTFYVYQRRFHADGVVALERLSRRPQTSPVQTAAELEAERPESATPQDRPTDPAGRLVRPSLFSSNVVLVLADGCCCGG
jgi:transposase-like protein